MFCGSAKGSVKAEDGMPLWEALLQAEDGMPLWEAQQLLERYLLPQAQLVPEHWFLNLRSNWFFRINIFIVRLVMDWPVTTYVPDQTTV